MYMLSGKNVAFTTQFCCIGHIDVKYVIFTSKDGEK
jgi:hypothetical protein